MRKLLLKTMLLLCALIVGSGTMWGQSATKTEGFETATAGNSYQGKVTVDANNSDCGIGWEIYYGCVSTSSKITGNNSVALRLYTSNNYGYLKTTTAIDGLSNVTFNAKAATSNGASIKVNISYSSNGTTWTNIETDKSLTSSSESYSVDIPSGGKYFQIAISENSTKPSKSNAQLTIDDVVFTYSTASSSAVATTTTIDDSYITNTDVYTSTEAGSLSASVTAGGNSVQGATVTWSGDNDDVATINSATGAVTLVGPGNVKFTASYSGQSDEYQASYAEYNMTVISSAPVTEETFTFSALGYTNAQSVATVNGSACTLTFANGTNTSNDPRYYDTGKGVRMYNGNTLTIASATKTIESIEFTFDGNNTTLALVSEQPGTLSDASNSKRTWTGSASSIQFTTTATNRIKVIKVIYEDDSKAKKPTLTAETSFLGSMEVSMSSEEEGAAIYYTTDGTTPTSGSTLYSAPVTINATTTFKAIAVANNKTSDVVEATYTLITPLTVTDALSAINALAANGTINDQYVAGKISQIDSYSSGAITYWISDDGTTTSQLQVYNGKGLSGANFTAATDLEVGDAVVVNGQLKKYVSGTNTTPEFNSGSQLISIVEIQDNDLAKTGDIYLSAAALSTTANATDYFNTSSDGAITCESGNTSVATVSAEGVVTPVAEGSATITVSQAATATYKAGEITINVIVAAASLNSTTIVVDPTSGSTVYGTPKVVDYLIDDTYDGTVAAVSSNTAVATVAITQPTSGEGAFTITPVAVGTAVITISAPATATFAAADDVTYTLTVTAPVGGTSAAVASTTATLDFTDNTEWSLPEGSSNKTVDEGSYSDGTYTIKVAGSTGNGYYWNNCLLMGKSGAYLTLPAFDKAVTQIDVVGTSGASPNVIQNIYVGETAVSTATTGAKDVTNEYAIDPAYQAAGNTYTLKVTSAHNTQISSIVVHFAGAELSVKLNGSGYATYCSQYPLDFSKAADYSAWYITETSGETITFSQVTGSVKGGTGLFLMGTAGSTITLTSDDSDNTLSGNKLVGTLAPTYFEEDAIYGLSGNTFKLNYAGTFKANKAYIRASEIDNNGSGVRAFTFVFVDPTTGITETRNVSAEEFGEVFNLAGQRMSKPQKGVNIINGKKVLVK